jgi:SAM-dependent methyltransferase
MDPIDVFSSKAALYDRYRWSYALESIQTIIQESSLSNRSTLADIGAGTGILTRQFAGYAGRLIAIEPNLEMGLLAATRLAAIPNCYVLAARAEATALPNQSIDLVTVAQATNWFEPAPTRREFVRILKPGGWLAILRNYGIDEALVEALEPIFPIQCDTGPWMRGRNQPRDFYFGGRPYLQKTCPLPVIHQTWDDFLGALLTTSYAPDPGHPDYPPFEIAAKDVFEQFSQDGWLHSKAVTELLLGQVEPAV